MSEHQLDFSTVLAACVHDMKNSLFMLLQSIEQLADNNDLPAEQQQELAKLHYEAYRVNTNLMQLLSLYRMERQRLPLTIEEYFVSDLFDELIAKNALYLESKEIVIDTDVDPDLIWYLDGDLINNLLTDVVNNALRYCNNKLLLSARVNDQQMLEIMIEDDGSGYPEQMLAFDTTSDLQSLDIKNGRTGLGLYFAGLIARSHKNKSVQGNIKLSNGGHFGGSVFTLTLP
ncbi:HAMP domain-containing histidine kinase [Neiella sp. HB171785]|uniref:histidine kinase n=1 Tax=Neiella litorisoli TaxID=2771431 RepID=A0A8J6ULM2_9GAMM|nr:HAMP domain-containing sensor histidine kinase [Neiella litorisoli]MBD1389235.1 HAMP domain-containing histidine kinase [Neiella litorisoli]